MYLLDTRTLELKYFINVEPGTYATLSHRWGVEEASFEQVDRIRSLNTEGARKVIKCCELALRDDLDYCWIDTVCIDKRASAELSEAINSMYRWYAECAICYVHMDDVHHHSLDDPGFELEFRNSIWFTRCWTLQELLAPVDVRFHDSEWRPIRGTQHRVLSLIADFTPIHADALFKRRQLWEFSIAERMSWASSRKATRVEDIAYSLLGIFQCNLPMLYGEGSKAFERLQEEIIRTTSDESIFAWQAVTDQKVQPGLLAESPGCFASCQGILSAPVRDQYVLFIAAIQQDDEDKEKLEAVSSLINLIKTSSGAPQGFVLTSEGLTGEVLLSSVDEIHSIAFLNVTGAFEETHDTFIGVYLERIDGSQKNFRRDSNYAHRRWEGTWSELSSMLPQVTRIFVQHKGFKYSYRLRKQYGIWLPQRWITTWERQVSDDRGDHYTSYWDRYGDRYETRTGGESPDLHTPSSAGTSSSGSETSPRRRRRRQRARESRRRQRDPISKILWERQLILATGIISKQHKKLADLQQFRRTDDSKTQDSEYSESEPEQDYRARTRSRSGYGLSEKKTLVSRSFLYRLGPAIHPDKRCLELTLSRRDQTGPIVNIAIAEGDLGTLSLIQLGITEHCLPYCIIVAEDCRYRTSNGKNLADAVRDFELDATFITWSEEDYQRRNKKATSDPLKDSFLRKLDTNAPYRGFWAIKLPLEYGETGREWICPLVDSENRNHMFQESYGWQVEFEAIDVFPKKLWKFDIRRLTRKKNSGKDIDYVRYGDRSYDMYGGEYLRADYRYRWSTRTWLDADDRPEFCQIPRERKRAYTNCPCPNRTSRLLEDVQESTERSDDENKVQPNPDLDSPHDSRIISGSSSQRSSSTNSTTAIRRRKRRERMRNRSRSRSARSARSRSRSRSESIFSSDKGPRAHSIDQHMIWCRRDNVCPERELRVSLDVDPPQFQAKEWNDCEDGTVYRRASFAGLDMWLESTTQYIPRLRRRPNPNGADIDHFYRSEFRRNEGHRDPGLVEYGADPYPARTNPYNSEPGYYGRSIYDRQPGSASTYYDPYPSYVDPEQVLSQRLKDIEKADEYV